MCSLKLKILNVFQDVFSKQILSALNMFTFTKVLKTHLKTTKINVFTSTHSIQKRLNSFIVFEDVTFHKVNHIFFSACQSY